MRIRIRRIRLYTKNLEIFYIISKHIKKGYKFRNCSKKFKLAKGNKL